MKSDVTHGSSGSEGDHEGLDRAIEILVINRVFVMPDSSGGICDLVANEANAIVSWIGLYLGRSRSGPGLDPRLRSDRAG